MQLETNEAEDMEESSTVKLQLPKRQHLRLHCLKIITGETMSNIATEALARYSEEEGLDEEVMV